MFFFTLMCGVVVVLDYIIDLGQEQVGRIVQHVRKRKIKAERKERQLLWKKRKLTKKSMLDKKRKCIQSVRPEKVCYSKMLLFGTVCNCILNPGEGHLLLLHLFYIAR